MALSGLVFVAPARADAPPGGTSAQTLPQWWGGVGRPGYVPDAEYAGGMPWAIAGLTAGSWQLLDPIAPATQPAPGLPEAQAPMAWYDSAAVILGEDAAWSGFGASLATAQGFVSAPGDARPRAMLVIVNGAHGMDRNSIFVTRGQDSGWLRGGATGDKRGGISDLAIAGDHMWTVAAGTKRGANRFDAGFTQRGMGESQLVGLNENPVTSKAEGASAQSQHAGWNRPLGRDSLALNLASGFDRRALVPLDNYSPTVWREAREDDADLQYWRRRGERAVALRLAVHDARVLRSDDANFQNQEWSTRSTWLSGRAMQPFAGGDLDLQLGVGRDRSEARAAFAPGASWRVGRPERSLRLFAERALVPIWSELEPGTDPFTQDTWLAGLDAAAGSREATSGSLMLVAGRTGSRATLLRYPLRAQSLYLGWRRDWDAYRFVLVQGTAGTHWRALAWDGTGYALARPSATSQPRVDPGLGARTGVECRFRVFAGDLGVRLRLEGGYVGARETENSLTDLSGLPIPNIMLPGFGTLAVGATLTLGDATIVLRAEGLGTGRHPESWVDPSQSPDFVYARDAGPQMRAEVTWPLFN